MKIETAMLLAAGRGERLRPLTDTIPKPLLLYHGEPLIVHHLRRFQTLGIKKVVINVSYLAQKIIDALGDGKAFDLEIVYSFEPVPLGSGGGLRQALPLLGEDPFLFVSSDIYTDFSFETWIDSDWSLENNLVHAVLTDKAAIQSGDFNLVQGHLSLVSPRSYIYGSMAVVNPAFIANFPLGHASLMPAFEQAISQNRATGEYYQSVLNINTVEEYK